MRDSSIKTIFERGLRQLQTIVSKTPAEVFPKALARDMFALETNARIACNFAMRGYCPLINLPPTLFDNEVSSKAGVEKQLSDTLIHLASLKEVFELDETKTASDKAGDAELVLAQPEFIHQYILPNFYFHISMVYAVARANGVALSKGDYDGYHAYAPGFSFIEDTASSVG